MEIDEFDLLQVAFLIEDNDHLSASREGLNQRKLNRGEAIKKLLLMLDLTQEEFEDKYARLHIG
jgi:hypothetical protein